MKTNTILLVDDDQNILDLLADYMDSFGLDCDRASDGEAALKKLQGNTYTAVITDITMPRMDGMQLLKHICKYHPRTGVIVITGGQTFSYTDVIKAGASDFISKPFTSDELEAKLNRLFREQNLLHQLEQQSILDTLTGLYNRRFFESKILTEVQRADRQQYNVFMQMIDVDNLKGYNDHEGQEGGDKLLQAVGKIMTQSIRENVDWAFRFGGDEFGIIFTQLEPNQIAIAADRILQKYAQMSFSNTGLSIGIARFVRHPGKTWQEDIDDLVARADKALYSAKKQGKNRRFSEKAWQPKTKGKHSTLPPATFAP